MSSVICTLFEGNYHYGVAALVNSLFKQGFKGEIFAGYKGSLPPWANKAVNGNHNWPGCSSVKFFDDLVIHFLPLETDYHLTNYKPDFMLRLLDGLAKGADKIFYFDPDIVIKAPWNFIDKWPQCGVAVCEDVNSPFPQFHPHRVFWRDYFKKSGFTLEFKEAFYANGGFLGLSKSDFEFLNLWKHIQEAMAPHIGGLSRSIFKSYVSLAPDMEGPFAPFGRTDQDALNAALEAWDKQVSMMGKEAMSFIPGAAVIPHALGKHKPWNKKYISRAFEGRSPNPADKLFWSSMSGNVPIKAYGDGVVKMKLFKISVASLIGRFYKSS
jgi:hypothetical protein